MHAEPQPHFPLWARLGAPLLAIVVVLLGIWVTGGLLTDDFRSSMVLTAVWFALVAGAGYLVWTRLPDFRLTAVAALAAFLVVGGVLFLGTVRSTTVNEVVATGPAALGGSFEPRAHETSGAAAIVEQGAGRVLTLTDFRTDAGPDLFVYLVPGRTQGEAVDGGTRLGRLKGNIGNQQYALPEGLSLGDGATVVIWCRAFSVSFGAAQLSAA